MGIDYQLLSEVLKILFSYSVEDEVHLDFLFFNFTKLCVLREKLIVLGSIYDLMTHDLTLKADVLPKHYLHIFLFLTSKFYVSGFLFGFFLVNDWLGTQNS